MEVSLSRDYEVLFLFSRNMAKYFILIGLSLLAIGAILYVFPGAFRWFGNLPGDFKSTDGNVKIYFPLTSMVLVSIGFSLLIRIIRIFN